MVYFSEYAKNDAVGIVSEIGRFDDRILIDPIISEAVKKSRKEITRLKEILI